MYSILWCSIDSFLAALAIGLVGRERGRSYGLIAAFSICDGISYTVGRGIRVFPIAAIIGRVNPFILSLCLAMLTVLLIVAFTRTRPSLVWCLPFLLGFDNFISGVVGLSDIPVQGLLVNALVSGLLACAGFVVARNVKSTMPRSFFDRLTLGTKAEGYTHQVRPIRQPLSMEAPPYPLSS